MTKDNQPLVTEVQFSFQQSSWDSRHWQSWPQNALPEFGDFCRFAGSFPGDGPNSHIQHRRLAFFHSYSRTSSVLLGLRIESITD